MTRVNVMKSLSEARTALLDAVEGLSEAEMITLPVAGPWTMREILAHVSGWAVWDLDTIKRILAGENLDLSVIQDVDSFNARLVADRSNWSLTQILAEMANTQIKMQELLDRLSDKELFGAGLFPGPYWNNLAEWLQIAWEHEEEHVAQILTWREGIS